MFVISVKPSGKKVFITVCAIILALTLFLGIGALRNSKPKLSAQRGDKTYSLKAGNNAEILEFFGQFGLKTSDEPTSRKKVKIPEVFNDVYNNYNEIQLSQGLDLRKYKGITCDSFTYKVMNYDGLENVNANILVYDGTIIGGDICSTNLDGFMHGFFKE